MAKAKKRPGKKKTKASRGKPARAAAKKKTAAGKRARTAKPRIRPAQAATGGETHTPIAVPGAWPFPMLSKT